MHTPIAFPVAPDSAQVDPSATFMRERLADLLVFLGKNDERGIRLALSDADFCRLAGLNKATLSKIRNGKSVNLTRKIWLKIAQACGVPPDTFSTLLTPEWRCISQFERERIDWLFDLVGKAEVVLSLTKDFGSFLLPDALVEMIEIQGIEKTYSNPKAHQQRTALAITDNKRRKAARQKCDYRLKLIAPHLTLNTAANRGRADWLDEVASGMKEHWKNTAVGWIGDEAWQRITDLINSEIPDDDWVKINVADNIVVCVYTYKHVFYTFEKQKIERLKTMIEHQIPEEGIEYPFPTINKDNESIFRYSYQAAIKYFDRRWRPGKTK